MVPTATLLVPLALGLVAAAPEPDERAVLRSDRAGSLAKPKPLTVDALAKLCADDAEATQAVYTAEVPAEGFRFGSYDEGALPLALDRPLLALDGAALLHPDEREAAFVMSAEDAKEARARLADKALTLEVKFRLAQVEQLTSCFTLEGSGQWAVHVEALAFAVKPASGAPLATLSTEAMKRLEAWVRPGDAQVRLEARALDGAVDAEVATGALAAARGAIETCTAKAREAITDPVTLAYVAEVSAAGKVEGVRAELVTAELDEEVECVQKALAAVEMPRAAKRYQAQLVVALDRPGFEALYW